MDVVQRLEAVFSGLDRQGLLGSLVQVVAVVVLTFVALRVAQRAVDATVIRLLDREATEGTAQELSAIEVEKRKETLRSLGGGALRSFILVIGFLMALRALQLDIGPAIAGLGIVGLALGLGAQNLVRDYVAGSFILIENHYGRGDVVKVVDVTGTVEDLSLRRTTLRDLDGTVHIVPNGLIGVASNLTRVWARVNVDITLADAADLDRASLAVERVGHEMATDAVWSRRVLEPARVERVEALAGKAVTLKVLGSVRAADRWAASSEVRRRILAAFASEGIELGSR